MTAAEAVTIVGKVDVPSGIDVSLAVQVTLTRAEAQRLADLCERVTHVREEEPDLDGLLVWPREDVLWFKTEQLSDDAGQELYHATIDGDWWAVGAGEKPHGENIDIERVHVYDDCVWWTASWDDLHIESPAVTLADLHGVAAGLNPWADDDDPARVEGVHMDGLDVDQQGFSTRVLRWDDQAYSGQATTSTAWQRTDC